SITIIIAYYIDLIVGDPPKWPHPVKLFGRYISFCETHFNKGRFKGITGLLSLIILIVLIFFITFYLLFYLYHLHFLLVLFFLSLLLLFYLYHLHFLLGLFVEALLIATTISQKGLKQAAMIVYYPLKEKNLPLARKKLSEIVGRDTDELPEKEVVRGTIETVAE